MVGIFFDLSDLTCECHIALASNTVVIKNVRTQAISRAHMFGTWIYSWHLAPGFCRCGAFTTRLGHRHWRGRTPVANRRKVEGTSARPRLAVFRSKTHMPRV